jgi:hypothetical protein
MRLRRQAQRFLIAERAPGEPDSYYKRLSDGPIWCTKQRPPTELSYRQRQRAIERDLP